MTEPGEYTVRDRIAEGFVTSEDIANSPDEVLAAIIDGRSLLVSHLGKISAALSPYSMEKVAQELSDSTGITGTQALIDGRVVTVSFRDTPHEDDPYKNVNPAMSYGFSKRLVEMGVEEPSFLDQYILTPTQEGTPSAHED